MQFTNYGILHSTLSKYSVYSSSSTFPAISLGFTFLLLLLHSQLYLWGSPFFFFFCIPSYISGVHHSSSSSAFPAISLGFTILLLHHSSSSSVFPAISLGFNILILLPRSQLYLWDSTFFFFFRVPSYISGVHHSSSCAFPAISLGITILGEIVVYVTIFSSNHGGNHIPSSWMVHTWFVFADGTHPSRT